MKTDEAGKNEEGQQTVRIIHNSARNHTYTRRRQKFRYSSAEVSAGTCRSDPRFATSFCREITQFQPTPSIIGHIRSAGFANPAEAIGSRGFCQIVKFIIETCLVHRFLGSSTTNFHGLFAPFRHTPRKCLFPWFVVGQFIA